MARIYNQYERKLRRDEADSCTFDSDGVVVHVTIQSHVTRRFAERYVFPPAYARAESQSAIKKLLENVDLFDAIVTTKERSFAVYDEKSGSVYLGNLFLDQDLPEVFITSYWYGRPFHADPDDVQIIVWASGVVECTEVYAAMARIKE